LKAFGATLPPELGYCLAPENNTETTAIGNAYHNPSKDPNILKKIIAYVTLHYLHVHKSLKTIDDDWHATNYN